MRLSYNILWFEDNEVSYNGKKEMVRGIVEDELGFKFPDPRREIDSQNLEQIDYSTIDLIIVDLNLANNDKGTTIVDFIRNSEQVYTEVIFYSSYGEDAVREALKTFRIDGAYCADRRDEDFEDKVRQVIKTTVKKVQDLNNMRGLIMAETSDIDHTMLEIINSAMGLNLFGIKDNLIERIYTNVESKVTNKYTTFNKWKKNSRIDLIIKDNLMFDASQKILALQFIIDSIEHEILTPHKNDVFSNSYSELKQKKRFTCTCR